MSASFSSFLFFFFFFSVVHKVPKVGLFLAYHYSRQIGFRSERNIFRHKKNRGNPKERLRKTKHIMVRSSMGGKMEAEWIIRAGLNFAHLLEDIRLEGLPSAF